MPISNKLPDGLSEFDVIICGGGPAGCVVAGRLAEADPSLAVLLIEGGENNDDKDNVKYPALFTQHLAPGSKTAIFYPGKKSDSVAGREVVVPAGGILGGGSSINVMLYSRAQGVDFDSWNMPGWSGRDMVPFMEKLESYHGPGKSSHGYTGPVQITDGGFRGAKSQEDYMKAALQLGYTEYKDLQDPKAVNNGFERAMKYVTLEGRRADAAYSYVHPLLADGKHPNLHVLCESKVVRVLFDENKRAIGVEYIANPVYHPSTTARRMTAKARKLVVVSSGALGTPSILERSGIGSRNFLEKASVPVVADVPGVGQNYDDHTLLFYPFVTNLGVEDTIDAIWKGGAVDRDVFQKMGRWAAVDVHAKIRPSEDEVKALGPAFKAAWDRDYKNTPNRPLMMFALVQGFVGDHSTIPSGQYMSIAVYSSYSYSRGSLHITGPNWEDPLDFDPGYLSDPEDLDMKMHVWAYKKMRTQMRMTDMYTSELQAGHPQFAPASQAACMTSASSREVMADPQYTPEDDQAIENFLRQNIGSCWHSLGTCKMAPREQLGVVDADLNVYGVRGLKCVDLSIAPAMVGANTCNTAYVVGEKGADIIMKELGL